MKTHTPVLLDEVMRLLNPTEGKQIIDATGGQGGHTKALLAKGASVLVLDADPIQAATLTEQFKGTHAKVVCANFRSIAQIAKEQHFTKIEGILFDLGLSMEQLDNSRKGFSYKSLTDSLDMRLNPQEGETAIQLLARLSEDELYEILARYGEEYYSRSIARSIESMVATNPINTVSQLVLAINSGLPSTVDIRQKEATYARVFQALRIAVNKEFETIKDGLTGASEVLVPGGVLVVITFHSGEDRIVKRFASTLPLSVIKTQTVKKYFRRSFERSATIRAYQKQ